MAHVTEIIEVKQVSDEAVTVKIRCCGNPLTDSVHTHYGIAAMTPARLAELTNKHHDKVAAKCHGMGKGKQLLASLATAPKTHEVI